MSMHPRVKEFCDRLGKHLKVAFKCTLEGVWVLTKLCAMVVLSIAFLVGIPFWIGGFFGFLAFIILMIVYICIFITLYEMDMNPLADFLIAAFGGDDEY